MEENLDLAGGICYTGKNIFAAVTEDVLGADVTQGAYSRAPEESKARIIQHLGVLLPKAFDDDLARLIR